MSRVLKYRLPREVLDAEIARITDLGVRLELSTRVEDMVEAMAEGFDAVFMAVGAAIGKRAYIPAGEAAHVLDAVNLLHAVEKGEQPLLGRKVVVYGGGNTAIDVARTAKRLGAEESLIVYRRTREHMPANDLEVEEALEEGVLMKWLSTVKHADAGVLKVERMELDDNGFPQPTGEIEELEADSLVLALGQEVDLPLLEAVPGLKIRDGVVVVDPTMMTGYPGIFAGGDMVPADRTVTTGIGHGKKAARRASTWEQVVQGLDESTALYEARRCMSCGNCFECDNCFGVCPDNAVIKLGPGKGFTINLDFCKGCGICVQECPSGSIVMVSDKS